MLPMAATSAACTLYHAREVKEAELVVYFTKFTKEDTTHGRYRRCRISRDKEEGATSFFVTPFRQDANTVVHKSNWPK